MALKDKLQDLSQQINVEKEEKKKNEENEKLKPIRAEIKKKEKEIFDLEIIKNSLDFKGEEEKDGQGMLEYAKSTAGKKKETKAELEGIASANPKALERMGVKNIDELVSNPKFAEEEEVVAYKEAIGQESDLILSDAKLKSRLAKLGIEINDDNFSYQTASEEIARRLDVLNNELMVEKIKTPEGKEEVEEMLAKHFMKEIPKMEVEGMWKNVLGGGAETDSVSISIGGYKTEFEILNQRADFKNINYIYDVLPKDFSEQIDKYGTELVTRALKKSYDLKIKESFLMADGKVNGGSIGALEKIEDVNPKIAKEALKLLSIFEEKKKKALELIDQKNEEFKELGGLPINDFGLKNINILGEYKKEKYINQLNYPTFFPSDSKLYGDQLNYQKIKEHITGRIDSINKYIEELESLTADEVKEYNNNNLPRVIPARTTEKYKKILEFSRVLREGIDNECYFDHFYYDNKKYSNDGKSIIELVNYNSAKRHFQEKIDKFEDARKKISEKISILVELRAIESELGNKYKTNPNIQTIAKKIEENKRNREFANRVLSEISSAEIKLPADEEAELSGLYLHFPKKQKEIDEINKDITKMEDQLEDKKSQLSREKKSEPRLFGKGKWQDKISALEKEIEDIENKIKEKKDSKKLKEKDANRTWTTFENYSFQEGPTTELKKMVTDHKKTGNSKEIFNELKRKLEEVLNEKFPDDIFKKYKKALDLQAKVNERRQ